jgi:hypothetical protein
VEVQNATGADGMAARVVDYLSGSGFTPDSLTAASNANGSVFPLTEIIDYTGKQQTVSRLAELLGIPPDRVRRADTADSALRTTQADIVVLLGADAQDAQYANQAPGAADGG